MVSEAKLKRAEAYQKEIFLKVGKIAHLHIGEKLTLLQISIRMTVSKKFCQDALDYYYGRNGRALDSLLHTEKSLEDYEVKNLEIVLRENLYLQLV